MVSARLGGAGWDRDHIWGRTREDRVLSNNPQSHSRQDRGTLRPTEIIFGVVRVRTGAVQNPPITLSAGPRDAQTHRDHIWGRTHGDRILSNNPDYGFGEARGAGWHRDHVWGYSALARAKPGTDGATGYAVLPLRFHRNARQGHTLFPASPAKATSRTLGLHTSEDSNFDLGILQGSETHRSTCGPAQA